MEGVYPKMKKYQKLYDRIYQFELLVATHTYCLSGDEALEFALSETKTRYRTGCKLIKDGVFTEDSLIAEFPLD